MSTNPASHAAAFRDRAAESPQGKGRGGGTGAYRGAHWHTPAEVRTLLEGLAVDDLRLRSAIVLPGVGRIERMVEQAWPCSCLLGAFLCVAGEVSADRC